MTIEYIEVEGVSNEDSSISLDTQLNNMGANETILSDVISVHQPDYRTTQTYHIPIHNQEQQEKNAKIAKMYCTLECRARGEMRKIEAIKEAHRLKIKPSIITLLENTDIHLYSII